MGVLIRRALLFGVYIRAPRLLKLSFRACSRYSIFQNGRRYVIYGMYVIYIYMTQIFSIFQSGRRYMIYGMWEIRPNFKMSGSYSVFQPPWNKKFNSFS